MGQWCAVVTETIAHDVLYTVEADTEPEALELLRSGDTIREEPRRRTEVVGRDVGLIHKA